MFDYRIFFSKTGSLAFISHLDFNRSFIRALKRANLPLKYSEGYNPRPKIAFGLPLSVGMDGLCELVDITLEQELQFDEVKNRLEKQFTNELVILEVTEPDKKIKNIKYAEYIIEFSDFIADTNKIFEILKNPPPVLKRSKSGEKMTDIKPMIKDFSVNFVNGSTIFSLILTAFDSNFLNPDYVVTAVKNADYTLPEHYKVTRKKIIFED